VDDELAGIHYDEEFSKDVKSRIKCVNELKGLKQRTSVITDREIEQN
jgi:hypothetical protein